jgi:ADP-heptose:LPS heptosyltransferase
LIKDKQPKMKIVVLGMKNDFGKLGGGVFDLCGKTDLKLLAAILSKSKAAIGADTGSMHLAAMMGIPSIFIFGASDINETAPLIGKFSLLINERAPKNIDAIKPQEVFERYQGFCG